MFDNNTSAPVPARDRPSHRRPPRPVVYFLEDVKGKVFWGATDPDCYHFLRQVLERRKPEGVQMIFSEVKDQISMLMFDPFGSDVIEKLYEVCDEEQMNQLVFSVTADVNVLMAVCLNSQGSKSMKKFLECLRTPEQKSRVISIFQPLTIPLVNHKIGSRVILHCFNIFPEKETEPIFDVITDNLFKIATKGSGSCLLGQVLKSKDFQPESRPRILSEIIENVHSLSLDPFGRAVVNHVIELRMQDVVRDIVARLTGAFACLSMNRYATLVVFTLMTIYKEEYAPQIINEIICSSDFSRILHDPCGCSIIEYARKYSTGALLKSLNHQIALHSDRLRSKHHGENVLPKSQGTVHLHSHCPGKNIKPRWKR